METSFSFWFPLVSMANLHYNLRGTVQSSSVEAFQSQSCYEFVCQSTNPYSGAANSSDTKPWAKHKGHTYRQQHADSKQVTLWPTFSSALISLENLYSQAHKANLLTEKTALACSLYGEKINQIQRHHTVLVAYISKRIHQSSEHMTSKENER